ncbi:matrixin family metalloprotease [Paenibacillus sp. GCM10027628]|uniref:matrixin family metalloprotease n=1 Tax=Paenibacillus sp. GCM10027628 TaxID=3273413 RepID=UPI0036322062
MVKKQLFSFLVILSIFISVYSPASAHHYRWTTMNPDLQGGIVGNSTGPFNYLNYFHEVGNTVSVGTPTAISSNVSAAIGSWSIIPLKFTSASDGQGDINVKSVAGGCGGGSGCYKLTAMISGPSNHNANYALHAEIIVPSENSGSDLTFMIAHELGHAIGLAEAYGDTPGAPACASFSTVMDSCNRVLPTSIDKSDVEKTYGGLTGGATNITTSWSSNTLNVQWKDNSLGERYYQVDYYKVSGGSESLLFSRNVSKDVGLIKGITTATFYNYSDKTILENSFSKANYSSGNYRVKIKPYYTMYARYGVSNQIDFSF